MLALFLYSSPDKAVLAGLRKAHVFTNSMLEEKEVLGLVVYVVGWWLEQFSRQNPINAFKTSKMTIILVIALSRLPPFQQAAFRGAPLALEISLQMIVT